MSDKSYKVGRGRPPLHSRYKPGQSGNPGGRPKGVRNLRTLIAEEFTREVTAKEGGRPVKRPAVAVLTRVMIGKAIQSEFQNRTGPARRGHSARSVRAARQRRRASARGRGDPRRARQAPPAKGRKRQ